MTAQRSLIRRHHTILGVCEGVGEDFGFNPLFLRIAFAAALFFSPMGAIAAYLGLGLIVLGTRLLVPEPAAEPQLVAESASAQATQKSEDEIALAA